MGRGSGGTRATRGRTAPLSSQQQRVLDRFVQRGWSASQAESMIRQQWDYATTHYNTTAPARLQRIIADAARADRVNGLD